VAIFVSSMAALVKLKYENEEAIQQCSVRDNYKCVHVIDRSMNVYTVYLNYT
jgi:hypothetical protein